MCVVSMVTDHFQHKWPIPPGVPHYPPTTPWLPTILEYEDYQELVRKAKAYDEMMKQKDCLDPEKERWAKWLDEEMRKRYNLEPTVLPLTTATAHLVGG